jgi:hypothetical protein
MIVSGRKAAGKLSFTCQTLAGDFRFAEAVQKA